MKLKVLGRKGDNMAHSTKRILVKKGDRYGLFTIVKEVEGVYSGKNRRRTFLCKCYCGNLKKVALNDLRTGNTKSCGCIKEFTSRNNGLKSTTHGMTHTKLYSIWWGMKQRCYLESNPSYKDYGGRGIRVCQLWIDDFQVFYDWSVENGYEEGLSIERIDVNGHYEPDNCTWIPFSEQSRNKRNTRLITFDNETLTLREWSEKLNLSYGALKRRLQVGWSVEKALTTPLAKWSKHYEN